MYLMACRVGDIFIFDCIFNYCRKDLANIVRRRGHRLIKELLTNTVEAGTDKFGSLRSLDGDSREKSDHEETEGDEEKPNDMIEQPADTPLINNDSATTNSLVEKREVALVSSDEIPVSKDPPMSLQEKVENFMKYGELDAVEDDICGDFELNDGSKKSNHEKSSVEGEPVMYSEGDNRHLGHGSNNNFGHNGTLLLPTLIPPAMEDIDKRDIYSFAQEPQSTDFDNNMHIEDGKVDNKVEIKHLKHMLHQKELELCRLKEDIEREKQALVILQAKAESEISKAQKLISEKDAELNTAEESLSGLVEAKIQYSGEGQMVEVAGSFNGWHQRIKLDPQPSSAAVDPIGSRKSRLWSTTLWLYPGVYEIKFIVDGHWKIDPEIESTINGGIENNILRVVR
ncbi:Protein PTST-like protein 3 chloroplastic [Bienertia sinuspersici]